MGRRPEKIKRRYFCTCTSQEKCAGSEAQGKWAEKSVKEEGSQEMNLRRWWYSESHERGDP
jgi:hypothetical protein